MSSDDDPPESSPLAHITAVVLAAGRGRRLQSNLPKPLFPICGRAMTSHVLHTLAVSGIVRSVVIVPPGDRGEQIERTLSADAPCMDLRFAVQSEPRGTADAVLASRALVESSHVLVINGDLPLITADHVRPLLGRTEADAVIATAVVDDAAKMGRITRDQHGNLEGIVEWRDASPAQRSLKEVNLGLYLFRAEFLWDSLERLVAEAASNAEAYVTDAIPGAAKAGAAAALKVALVGGRLNVETLADAANAETLLRRRIVSQLLEAGVQIRDRNAVWIDATTSIESGAVIEPGSHVRGRTTIAGGSRVGPNAIIEDATVGRQCVLESCTVRGSTLHEAIEVGPYSTIRPGCEIESNVHIGTHAELKESHIGEHVQIGHFSYVGDADVGARTNIGAGAITCNFDGESKHRTSIGQDAFIGSDTMLIAPLHVGDRARTGAGAVVNRDVPDDGTAVGHPARLTRFRRSTQGEEAGE